MPPKPVVTRPLRERSVGRRSFRTSATIYYDACHTLPRALLVTCATGCLRSHPLPQPQLPRRAPHPPMLAYLYHAYHLLPSVSTTHLLQMVLYAINLFLRVAESPDWPEDHRSFIMQQLPDLLSRAESLKGQTTQHTMPPMPPVGMPLAAHAILSTALPLAPGGACPQTQRPFPDQGQTPTSKGAFDAAAAAMYPPINHPPTSSASASSALHSPQAASCAACGTYLGKSLMSRLGVTAESTARRCARCHGSFCDSCFKNDSVQNDMCKGCEGETASFAS